MRETLFRGKRVDNGEWVYGDLLQPTKEKILNIYEISDYNSLMGDRYEVNPDTVGQYTGLTDKNGKKIFEGDIIRSNSERGYIEYYPNDCAFEVVDDHGFYWLISEMSNIEVIGNIHDNPELLKDK